MRPHSLLRGLLTLALASTCVLTAAAAATAAATVTAPAAPDAVVAATPDVSLANTKAHLQQFQNIATANGGNRRSTGSGYRPR